jgi:hypothetical protein
VPKITSDVALRKAPRRLDGDNPGTIGATDVESPLVTPR